MNSEPKPKANTPLVATQSNPPPPPSVPLSPPSRVPNGRLTDTESKSKAKTNGHHSTKGTERLNGKTTTINNNKNEPSKSTPSRWTSTKKPNGGIPSKHPPSRPIVH